MDKLLALASEIKKNRSQIQAILETPPEVHHFVGEKGDSGVEGKKGKEGVAGPKGLDGKDGTDGLDGVSIVDVVLDFDNSLSVELSNGAIVEVGQLELPKAKDGVIQTQVQTAASTGAAQESASGTALMNFGASNKVAEVIVTGVSLAKTTSIVMSQMRVEATAEHPVDDLQIDPIRVLVKDLVVGTGFTLLGAMDNAPANGTYKIDWHLTN
tara:strand:+ start:1144 stop:1779 length:636 start_codon:yes stop_codon:yes gene_type:complete